MLVACILAWWGEDDDGTEVVNDSPFQREDHPVSHACSWRILP